MSLISVLIPAAVKNWSALAVMATALLTLPPDHVSTPDWQAKEELEAQLLFDSIDPTYFIVVEASEAEEEVRWQAEYALVDALPLEEVLRQFEEMHALQDHASSFLFPDCVPLYRRDPLGQRLFVVAERGAPEERAKLRAHIEHFLQEVYPTYSADIAAPDNLYFIGSEELYPVLLAKMDVQGESLACLVRAATWKHSTGVNTSADQFFALAIKEVLDRLIKCQGLHSSAGSAEAEAISEYVEFRQTALAPRFDAVPGQTRDPLNPSGNIGYVTQDHIMQHYDTLLAAAQRVVQARG